MLPSKSCFFTLVAAATFGASYTIDTKSIWAKGIVPIKLTGPPNLDTLAEAINVWEKNTCLRFVLTTALPGVRPAVRRRHPLHLQDVAVGTREPITIINDGNSRTCMYDHKGNLFVDSVCTLVDLQIVLAPVIGVKELLTPETPFDTTLVDAVNNAYGCDKTRYPRGKLAPSDEPASTANSNPDKSKYEFMLDDTTAKYFESDPTNQWLAIQQECPGENSDDTTDNWNYVKYNPKTRHYIVEVDRCKKMKSRHAGSYRGLFCANNDNSKCPTTCVRRKLRGPNVKGVVVKDELPWLCHESVGTLPIIKEHW